EFEKRIKMVMDGMMKDGKAIAYIDEIHNLVGAGASNDGSMDASNILKPYLEENSIRFIGSTTFDEYKRYFAKSKGMIRRFQDIEIAEPSTDECVKIINGLKNKYEKYHNVKYGKGVIEYAVDMSARFINNRFLPDKAIDLIDEAGAFLEMHPLEEKKQQTVTKQHIADILSKVCKVESMAIKKEEDKGIKDLEQNIKQKIYGQDKAVEQVVEAIQMSKAGLVDENKPIASFLFVGPTGVGKTELCKVLAEQMGIQLVRFDMSEYTEKHTVAKLIGAPAGYIGYEDGGLLTDAIRKSPNCVLLLDEIEKAHSDIYNILLQAMDYARLTDNKGQKADFRHVVLVMTSNAGAQFASQASIGYFPSASSGESMMKQVKKTFKPEFLNRLNGIAVFNDMDLTMAGMILDKKIGELQTRLSAKNVALSISDEAREILLKKGFTKEYGAREMDRVIHKNLATQLAKKILFGSLKKGGNANATVSNGEIIIE
ncbi:MAG: AAA family ATPase, partial [Bacteroidaceae bacterium]|nr:AAA family ATPase [Bacteroidaceae bacterium]